MIRGDHSGGYGIFPAQKNIIFLFPFFISDIEFVSNGKPFSIFDLTSNIFNELATTTTTTSTTTTTTTTTQSTTTTTTTTSESSTISEENADNSPITWLGKFVFNGLPSKLFDFKSPFSDLGWLDSLKDIKITPSNFFTSLFK